MNPESTRNPDRRPVRVFVGFILAALVVGIPLAPFFVELPTSGGSHVAQTVDAANSAHRWQGIRLGKSGTSSVSGLESGTLINTLGITWQHLRMHWLVPAGLILVAIAVGLIAAFYGFAGPNRLHHSASGQRVTRFSPYQRIVHWFTAIIFLLLALTGLVLLYGRMLLIPLFGPKSFAFIASACKEAHNLFGPIFLLALVLLLIEYGRDNLFKRADLRWLRRAGGLLGSHVSSHRYNAGEKIWFWLLTLLGFGLCITGLMLVMWSIGWTRPFLEFAHLVHAGSALVLIAASLGHIYLGSVGTEGTLEGMTRGDVDLNWARQHHDLWLTSSDVPADEGKPERGNG